ncbi:MAG: PD-(D/E)XK nuclease family protein, partial [Lachnospiraceae bacterium]|nr:PD-(D/E)XK nuclease family protein [Lachnospiraceae bacterium]
EIDTVDELITAAFKSYTANPLSKAVAKAIYGQTIMNSVSRMEEFATCQYKHFLKHGLIIRDRDEYDFERRDVGNVAHSILEDFGKKLDENRISWLEFDEDTGKRLIDECLSDAAASYNETILYSNARNQYFIERLRRIMNRTIFNLQTQLRKGSFMPEKAEFSFGDFELMGRIDRFDICEDEGRVYVKIIDYKTGSKKFDLSALYYGLQMQLAVYMDEAVKYEKKLHPDKEIIPAAMLYYNVKDPIVEVPEGASSEEINSLIDDKLRMTGVVNSDEYVIRKLDSEFEKKSSVIPVEFLKGGGFAKASSVYTREEMNEISCFVNKKIKEIGQKISDGEIKLNPYVYGDSDACKYCDYRGVCGYDENLAGYKKRNLKSMSRDEVMELIEKESENEL